MDCIPCLFLRNPQKSTKILIYFHGNAEDLGKTLPFLKMVQSKFDTHIIAVEYPGYGVYEGEVNEEAIYRDANRVVEFTQRVLRWPTQDLLVMGRSIGSGPACYLASAYNTGALLLVSPYTSIRGVVRFMFGRLSQYFIKERFKNFEMMAKVKCPTFILHGERDTVIPAEHARRLSDLCRGPTCLVVSESMDHNSFDFEAEFAAPLLEFFSQNGIEGRLPAEQCRNRESGASFMFRRPYFSYVRTPSQPAGSSNNKFSKHSHIITQRETVVGNEV